MNKPLTSYAKGVMGETAAAEYARKAGMTILERRFKAGTGEIDLVLLHEDTLIFAEIKTRETASARDAVFAVTLDKQRRLMDAARFYLGLHPEYMELPCRFDVFTVTREGIRHYPNAFEWRE